MSDYPIMYQNGEATIYDCDLGVTDVMTKREYVRIVNAICDRKPVTWKRFRMLPTAIEDIHHHENGTISATVKYQAWLPIDANQWVMRDRDGRVIPEDETPPYQ